MEFDLNFYLLAIFVVVFAGISKSGFVGGGALMAVPLLSLLISPQVAAGIMLPILVAMDFMNVWRYRKHWSAQWYWLLFPASLVGIAIGAVGFHTFSADGLKLFIGILALFFAIRYFAGLSKAVPVKPLSKRWGRVLGALGGLGSFIAHAGGPPIDSYMLSQKPHKTQLVATSVYLFTSINLVKLPPYYFLGLLSQDNLTISLLLLPFVPIGVFLGHYLHERVSQILFDRLAHTLLTVTAVKLIWDGVSGLL